MTSATDTALKQAAEYLKTPQMNEIYFKKGSDGLLNFDQIFAGVLFEGASALYGDHQGTSTKDGVNYHVSNDTHARFVNPAMDFFIKVVPPSRSVVDYLHRALMPLNNFSVKLAENRLAPWSEHPFPTGKIVYYVEKGCSQEDAELLREHQDVNILRIIQQHDGWQRSVTLRQSQYPRVFGQIISGALSADYQRRHAVPFIFRVPPEERYKDTCLTEMDYFPEGLRHGAVAVRGNVGALCGKHSEGGAIFVKGNASTQLGDCARNTSFYVLGDVASIGNITNCEVFVGGKIIDQNYTEQDERNRIVTGADAKRHIRRSIEKSNLLAWMQ